MNLGAHNFLLLSFPCLSAELFSAFLIRTKAALLIIVFFESAYYKWGILLWEFVTCTREDLFLVFYKLFDFWSNNSHTVPLLNELKV
jgi:hypothetical protein